MNERQLSVMLREMARSHGMCDKFYNKWKDDEDLDSMLDMFVDNQDFCVKNDFPSAEFISKYVDVDDLHRHNVYIDEDIDICTDKSEDYVVLGECCGTIRIKGFAVSNITLRHGCSIDVKTEGFARVFIRVFDDAECTYEKKDMSRVAAFDYKGGI